MFAQQNCLTSLAPLAALPHLDTLNVSANRLATLDGLDALPVLTSLQARLDLQPCAQLRCSDDQPPVLSLILRFAFLRLAATRLRRLRRWSACRAARCCRRWT